MLRYVSLSSACIVAVAFTGGRPTQRRTLAALADASPDEALFAAQYAAVMDVEAAGTVGDHDESLESSSLDPGVAVSLLATKRRARVSSPPGAATTADLLREDELALKFAGWEAKSKKTPGLAGKLEHSAKAVHKALSTSPGHMFGAVVDASPVNLPNEGAIVDRITDQTWSAATYAKLGVAFATLLFVFAQSFTAGDLVVGSTKGRGERERPQQCPRPSAEPAPMFTLEPQGLLLAGAGRGGHAEIRGPAPAFGPPALRASIFADKRGQFLKVGPGDGEPLVVLGPVESWRSPQVMSVQRTSTGIIDSLEPLGAGHWALRRDGHTELSLKCDNQQRTVELRAPVGAQARNRIPLPRLEEFVLEEDEEEEDGPIEREEQRGGSRPLARGASVASSGGGVASAAGGIQASEQRLVARAKLKTCSAGGGAGAVFDVDVLEFSFAAGDEVVLPLSCIVAALLMSPDVLGTPPGPRMGHW